jgi:hypothetical protein
LCFALAHNWLKEPAESNAWKHCELSAMKNLDRSINAGIQVDVLLPGVLGSCVRKKDDSCLGKVQLLFSDVEMQGPKEHFTVTIPKLERRMEMRAQGDKTLATSPHGSSSKPEQTRQRSNVRNKEIATSLIQGCRRFPRSEVNIIHSCAVQKQFVHHKPLNNVVFV